MFLCARSFTAMLLGKWRVKIRVMYSQSRRLHCSAIHETIQSSASTPKKWSVYSQKRTLLHPWSARGYKLVGFVMSVRNHNRGECDRRGSEEGGRTKLHVWEIHSRWESRLTWSVGAAMRAGTCGERRVKEGGRRTLNQWRWLRVRPGQKVSANNL